MNLRKNVYIVSAPLFVALLTAWVAAAKPQADPPYTAVFQGDVTGIVINMKAFRPKGKGPRGNETEFIVELEGPGQLYFPFNGILGDGIHDPGDALLEANKVDSDGDGKGDLFDEAIAVDEDESTICIPGTIKFGATEDVDVLGQPNGAGFTLTWTGTKQHKPSSYRIFVGAFSTSAVPKNWWMCPNRQQWPDFAWLLFGVDPLAGSNNCAAPVVIGQEFNVKRLGMGGSTIWSYGQAGTTAFVDISTAPE